MKKLLIFCIALLAGIPIMTSCSGDEGGEGEVSNDYIRMKQGGRAITFNRNETSRSIEIESNCSWTISVSTSNWSSLSFSPTSGSGNQNILLETDENNTTSERTAKLTFKSSGTSVTFDVSQAAGQLSLKVSPEEYVFDANGGQYVFNVEGNTDWAVDMDSKPDWCEIVGNSTGKSGTSQLMVKVGENPGITTRNGLILIKGETTATIKVSQQGKSYSLTLSDKEFYIDAVGGQVSFKVTCNGTWRLSVDKPWCKVSKTNGLANTPDGETLIVSCDPNTTTEQRSAHVTVVAGNDAKVETLEIAQLPGTMPEVTAPQYEEKSETELGLTATFTSMFDVTEYGFCYGLDPNPTTKVKVGDNGGKNGTIETTLTLEDGKTYYIRTYAVSAVGAAYSTDIQVEMKGKQPGKDDNQSPDA